MIHDCNKDQINFQFHHIQYIYTHEGHGLKMHLMKIYLRFTQLDKQHI